MYVEGAVFIKANVGGTKALVCERAKNECVFVCPFRLRFGFVICTCDSNAHIYALFVCFDIYIYIYIYVCLPVCLSVCLSVYTHVFIFLFRVHLSGDCDEVSFVAQHWSIIRTLSERVCGHHS